LIAVSNSSHTRVKVNAAIDSHKHLHCDPMLCLSLSRLGRRCLPHNITTDNTSSTIFHRIISMRFSSNSSRSSINIRAIFRRLPNNRRHTRHRVSPFPDVESRWTIYCNPIPADEVMPSALSQATNNAADVARSRRANFRVPIHHRDLTAIPGGINRYLHSATLNRREPRATLRGSQLRAGDRQGFPALFVTNGCLN
jgi:hypothetical protein